MTKFDEAWAARHESKRRLLAETGMYREEDEHSSCGVGLVVAVDGKPRRQVVEAGITALKAIWHRGAVDADGQDPATARASTSRFPSSSSTTRSAARAMSRATS